MSSIFTPSNQLKHTNVSVVRLKKAGKRFEIACYKNKIMSYRAGVEKDLDEVLQTQRVFINVSKGQFAKKEDLTLAFGTDDEKKICVMILEKGEIQINEKERQAQSEQTFRDIANIVVEKTLNPTTKSPYTPAAIERAMKEAHYAARSHISTKKQALEVIKILKTKIPLDRVQMRLRIAIISKNDISKFEEYMQEHNEDMFIEKTQKNGDSTTMDILIDPGLYRPMDEFMSKKVKSGKIEVIDPYVRHEGDIQIDSLVLNAKNKASTSNNHDSDDDSDSDVDTKKKKKKNIKKKNNESEESDDDNVDIKTKKKRTNKKEILTDSEDEVPSKKSSKGKNLVNSDDESDDNKRKSATKNKNIAKNKQVHSDSESEEDKYRGKKANNAGSKKIKDSEDDFDSEEDNKKSTRKQADSKSKNTKKTETKNTKKETTKKKPESESESEEEEEDELMREIRKLALEEEERSGNTKKEHSSKKQMDKLKNQEKKMTKLMLKQQHSQSEEETEEKHVKRRKSGKKNKDDEF